jgi:AcrR family transcriptional regulator
MASSSAQPTLTPGKSRRSQQERRDGTQRKLLEATLDCLGELGHAGTTTTEIVRRAGVSQGSLFKHYPSKAELLAAAVALLFDELVAGYEEAFAALPQDEATADAAFELLWGVFTGPRLAVAFELYMVGRTDPALARCLAPVVQRHRSELVKHARALFPEAARQNPELDAWVDLAMCAMEGLVVEGYGAGNTATAALLVLKRLVVQALGGSPSGARADEGGRAWTR